MVVGVLQFVYCILNGNFVSLTFFALKRLEKRGGAVGRVRYGHVAEELHKLCWSLSHRRIGLILEIMLICYGYSLSTLS